MAGPRTTRNTNATRELAVLWPRRAFRYCYHLLALRVCIEEDACERWGQQRAKLEKTFSKKQMNEPTKNTKVQQ